jgi:dihydroorotase
MMQANRTHNNGRAHMNDVTRRRFLSGCAALASAGLVSPCSRAEERFELVIRGGQVIDPSQSLSGRRDIGIRWGRIAAIEPDIAIERTVQSIDATGKLVVPGLVDMHSHVYPQSLGVGAAGR